MIPLHNNVVHYEIPSKSTPNFHFKMFQVPNKDFLFEIVDANCDMEHNILVPTLKSNVLCFVVLLNQYWSQAQSKGYNMY